MTNRIDDGIAGPSGKIGPPGMVIRNECSGCESPGVIFAYGHFFCSYCLEKLERALELIEQNIGKQYAESLKDSLKRQDVKLIPSKNFKNFLDDIMNDGNDWIRIGKWNESFCNNKG